MFEKPFTKMKNQISNLIMIIIFNIQKIINSIKIINSTYFNLISNTAMIIIVVELGK